jgi:hypothetical protein
MISLYQYLIENKKYSEFESLETVLRYENGFNIPDKIKADIKDYWSEQKIINWGAAPSGADQDGSG